MAICLKKAAVMVSAESISLGKDDRGISGEISLSAEMGSMGFVGPSSLNMASREFMHVFRAASWAGQWHSTCSLSSVAPVLHTEHVVGTLYPTRSIWDRNWVRRKRSLARRAADAGGSLVKYWDSSRRGAGSGDG